MTVRALAAVSFRRILRDRTTLFFLVVLPLLVILLIGMSVRDFDELAVGLVDEDGGPLGTELVVALEGSPAVHLRVFGGDEAARTALRRGEVQAVVVVPEGLDAALRDGRPATVTVRADQANTTHQAALSAVAGVVDTFGGRVTAARAGATAAGIGLDGGLAAADRATDRVAAVDVDLRTIDAGSDFLPFGFSYSAPTMLTLFVFVNALAGGAALIQSRQLGIYERMLAGPVRPAAIVAGEATTYLGISLVQSVLVVVTGAVVFGVSWGDPLAAAAIVGAWSLVGTGAGMLSGSLFRTADQASSVGPVVGIVAGMLGGCMWPLEIVPPVMRTIGHAVPHAWAVDAWIDVLSRGAGLTGILLELAVILAFAAAFLAVASARLRSRMVAA